MSVAMVVVSVAMVVIGVGGGCVGGCGRIDARVCSGDGGIDGIAGDCVNVAGSFHCQGSSSSSGFLLSSSLSFLLK